MIVLGLTHNALMYQVDLEPQVKQALGHLRRFHKHVTSADEDLTEEEWKVAVLAARQELLDYAKLVETVSGSLSRNQHLQRE